MPERGRGRAPACPYSNGDRRRTARSSCSTSWARRDSPRGCATQKRVLVTDTTMRDAHQSLLATRMRTHDIAAIAGTYARGAAAALLAGMLGRRDLRRRHALPDRGPVGAAGAGPRRRAQPPAADAAARRQRRRLHELSRQCGAALRQPGGCRRHRPFPRLRLPELGRQHARRHGRGARRGQALRGGDLLHRRHPRSGARQIRPRNTTSGWRRNWRRPARTSSPSRTWPGC